MLGITSYVRDDEFKMIVCIDRIDIVNYLELLELKDDIISFKINGGKIVITGSNLTIKKLLNREALVMGEFNNIEMGKENVQ